MATNQVTTDSVPPGGKKRNWILRSLFLALVALVVGNAQLVLLTGCSGNNCCSNCCHCICNSDQAGVEPVERCGISADNFPFDNSCISSCSAASQFGDHCVPK